jgi:four helix bundle protein
MQKAKVSIPPNIAEGQALQHRVEGIQILYISPGSLAELDTQSMPAKNLFFIEEGNYSRIDSLIQRNRKDAQRIN